MPVQDYEPRRKKFQGPFRSASSTVGSAKVARKTEGSRKREKKWLNVPKVSGVVKLEGWGTHSGGKPKVVRVITSNAKGAKKVARIPLSKIGPRKKNLWGSKKHRFFKNAWGGTTTWG